MPKLVFGPRRPVIIGPPVVPPGPQQQPGRVTIARAIEAAEALLLGGAALAASAPGLALPMQLPGQPYTARAEEPPPWPGAVSSAPGYAPGAPTAQTLPRGPLVVAATEPLPPELLAGRVAQSRYGLAQPPVQPTAGTPPPAATGMREDPPPEPGRVVRGRAGAPLTSSTPTPRPTLARAEEPPPFAGMALVADYGFPDARRPVRATVARTEDRPPEGGAVRVASAPGLARPRGPGRVALARAEEPPPFAGLVILAASAPGLALPMQLPGLPYTARAEDLPPPFRQGNSVYRRPLVPSDRYAARPLVARGIDAPPEEGRALVLRAFWAATPGARFTVTLARTDEPPPWPGSVIKGPLPLPNLKPQQLPGRPLVARGIDAPPFGGLVQALIGFVGAGAVPPAPPTVTPVPGGRVQRADAWSRRVQRSPRVNGIALAYQTKTKTPSEALSLVFDFSNFPEVVGGATIASALVTGPGGAPLTGLVAGPPVVLAAATVVDNLGTTVAAGQGVAVTFFGGGASSDVVVECQATLNVGDAPKCLQAKIAVRNAI